MAQPRYHRILLKISGEGLCREAGFGLDMPQLESIAEQIAQVARSGVQVAVVIGGGNFVRGQTLAAAGHVQRATADYMGMLATVINAMALQDTLEHLGQPTRVASALTVLQVCEPFIRRKVIRHLEKGRVAVLAAGVGNPFFTTDTCAALRATELQAQVLLKATKVDGVYSGDPRKDPEARCFDKLSYRQVIRDNLRVMDMTAISLAMESNIPIVVFNLKTKGNIARVAAGEPIGTLITGEAGG
ncbi:MAG: UMP kinase [Planctomycetes bacterium]|jgi:uridylate kinase|nr:UMP kinase [Planctomycetota bacterium]